VVIDTVYFEHTRNLFVGVREHRTVLGKHVFAGFWLRLTTTLRSDSMLALVGRRLCHLNAAFCCKRSQKISCERSRAKHSVVAQRTAMPLTAATLVMLLAHGARKALRWEGR